MLPLARATRLISMTVQTEWAGFWLPAATAVFKKKLHRMIDWWEGEIAALPVTVHLGYRVAYVTERSNQQGPSICLGQVVHRQIDRLDTATVHGA